MPDALAYVLSDDDPESPLVVYLMHLPDGEPVALSDSGASIWLLAAEGDVDVCAAVAENAGLDLADVKDDVEAFLAHLVEVGLLERTRALPGGEEP